MRGITKVPIGEIPIPLINYVYLIKNRKSPFYEVAQLLLKDMEFHYRRALTDGQSEIVYAINPRVLADELEILVQNGKNKKLTNINICRTIRAFCCGSKLKKGEDFWVSTTSGGRKNYHINVNQRTLNSLSKMLL